MPIFASVSCSRYCGSILLLIALNWRRLKGLRASLDKWADASVLPIFNAACQVGYGAIIAAAPVFDLISDALLSLPGSNHLITVGGIGHHKACADVFIFAIVAPMVALAVIIAPWSALDSPLG